MAGACALTMVLTYPYLPFPVFLAGALLTLRVAAALVFFTAFILNTSFPRSVAFDFRVYVGEVTAVSRRTALHSQRSLAAEVNSHDEVTGNRRAVILAMFWHEAFAFSPSCRRCRFLKRLSARVRIPFPQG